MKTCYALSYQNMLLEALKATKANDVDVDIVHQLNGADVDWALGAAIAQYISQSHTVVISEDPLDVGRGAARARVAAAARPRGDGERGLRGARALPLCALGVRGR